MNLRRAIIFFAVHVLRLASGRVAYDFPDGALSVLRAALQESFSCDSKVYGYYADVSNGCQVFHVCLPVMDALGNRVSTDQFSFFCGNRTVFSQDSLQCVHEDEAYPCELSESIYELANSKFGTAEGIAVFDQPLDSLRENRPQVFESISLPETPVFEFGGAQENRISAEPQLSEVEEPFPQLIEAPEPAAFDSVNSQTSDVQIQENQEKTFDDLQGSDNFEFELTNEEPFVQDTFVQDGFEEDNQAIDLSDTQTERNGDLAHIQVINVEDLGDIQEGLPVEFN